MRLSRHTFWRQLEAEVFFENFYRRTTRITYSVLFVLKRLTNEKRATARFVFRDLAPISNTTTQVYNK